MLQNRSLMRGICLILVLLAIGCGNPNQDIEGESGITASENGIYEMEGEITASGNGIYEMQIIELSNGLYAYLTTEVPKDVEIDGIIEWIVIQDKNPENGTFYDAHRIGGDDTISANWILIPNVYGTITDLRMDDNSDILICYRDDEGEDKNAEIKIDFYASEGDIVTTPFGRIRDRIFCLNREELIGETVFPVEVWSETFSSEGSQYKAVFSRISPMYETIETACWLGHKADYQFTVQKGDDIIYLRKLYEFTAEYEEIHYMEDVNGDGVDDFILLDDGEGNDIYEPDYAYPYVFVWSPEEETYAYEGMIVPDGKAVYDEDSFFVSVLYDKDTATFYDVSSIYQYDFIYGSVIIRGVKFVDGEWKTVYQIYFGTENENNVMEIKYNEEGDLISETTYAIGEINNLIDKLYGVCELNLFRGILDDYTKEDIEINEQFSYSKYVRNEE